MENQNSNLALFSQKFVIRPHEVDARHYLLPRYMMWILQEAAVNHIESLHTGYDDLIKDNLAWALAGFKVEINQMPMWKDEITVKTWGKSASGIFTYRDFEVTTAGSNIPLIKATSNWFIMDLNLRRPVRVEPYANILYATDAISYPLKKSSMPDPASLGPSTMVANPKVCYEDLDHNQHANNVHYIRYMFNSLNDDFKASHILSEFEIYFTHELSCKDEAISSSWNIENSLTKFFHALSHPKGGLAAIAKTSWKAL